MAAAVLAALLLAEWVLLSAQPAELPEVHRRGFPSGVVDRWAYVQTDDEYAIYEAVLRQGVDMCLRGSIGPNRTGGWFGEVDEFELDPELRDELRRISPEVLHFDVQRLRRALPDARIQDEDDLRYLEAGRYCVPHVSPIAFSRDRQRAVLMVADESDVAHSPFVFFERHGPAWAQITK